MYTRVRFSHTISSARASFVSLCRLADNSPGLYNSCFCHDVDTPTTAMAAMIIGNVSLARLYTQLQLRQRGL